MANTLPAPTVAHFGVGALILLKLAGMAAISTILVTQWCCHPQSRWLTLRDVRAYCLVLTLITVGNCYAIFLQLSHR